MLKSVKTFFLFLVYHTDYAVILIIVMPWKPYNGIPKY